MTVTTTIMDRCSLRTGWPPPRCHLTASSQVTQRWQLVTGGAEAVAPELG